ncbi:OmpA/MotB family protein [Pistricoccus aurantiacus]|uniref:OmpA/MotB family protein n=1 Tax=Pistricoccus aurantiacus TaxID=1883414 RepID=UPI003643459B
MIENPRATSHRDVLLDEATPDDTGSIWMLSYLDVMTLLVALFALLLSLAGMARQTSETRPRVSWQPAVALVQAVEQARVEKWQAVLTLQDFLKRQTLDNMQALEEARRPIVPAGEIAPGAVVAALGVAKPRATPWVNTAGAIELVRRHRFATQRLDEEAIQGALVLNRVRALPNDLSLDGVEITPVDKGIRLRIQDQLLFSTGRGTLRRSGYRTVKQLLEIVERYDGEVSVEGHTDNLGINTFYYPSNWELSTARATAIVRYFLEAGIDPSRVRAIGYADTRPLASNETAEGRAANRRVEVILKI